MSLDEEALETAANGGMMDFVKWASMVEPLLDRLDHIVYNVFPMPKAPTQTPPPFNHHHPPSAYPSSQLQDANSAPSSSNKENACPTDLQTPPRPTAPSTADTSASVERVPDSQPQSFSGPSNEPLPRPLMLLLNSIRSTMRAYFTSKPPHTIQRLAELILRPNTHYRTLPAYLRAMDRVVTVTSSADNFPLQMQSANQPNGLMNGETSDHGIGGDDSLGGALLTPIPWLSSATSFEEGMATSLNQGLAPDHEPITSVPSVHQQQLQHQEAEALSATQQSALQTHPTTTTPTAGATVENEVGADPASPPPENSEEVPHARGPPTVGVEDMGLQDGKDVEMPLSKSEGGSDGEHGVQNGEQPKPGDQAEAKSEADNDGDILLGDVKNGGREGQSTTGTDTPKDTEQGIEKKDD